MAQETVLTYQLPALEFKRQQCKVFLPVLTGQNNLLYDEYLVFAKL
jgi:hypothetical protein